MNPVELETGLVKAAEILRGFYEGLEQRRVLPAEPIAEIVRSLEGSLGEQGVGLSAALVEVEQRLLPRAMAVPHPLYLGLLNSSPLAGGIVAATRRCTRCSWRGKLDCHSGGNGVLAR